MAGRKTYSAAEKERFAAERQAKLDRAAAMLADKAETLAGSDEWQAMLAFAGQFHHYSFRNQLLIQIQCPGATYVAGFARWKQLGRKVVSGPGSGISILAPIRRTVEDAETGERVRTSGLRGVKPATVFDISQTEGPDVPTTSGAQLLQAEGDDVVYAAIVALLAAQGWQVVEVDAVDGHPAAEGVTDFLAKRVEVVTANRSGADRLSTLLHEYGHATLHGPTFEGGRAVRELEAESFAYVVLNWLGIDAACYSVDYVTGWAGGNADLVRATAERVVTLAKTVLDALDPKAEAAESAEAA